MTVNTNKCNFGTFRRLRFSLLSIVLGVWVIWSFSHTIHIHVAFVHDEAINNLPPHPQWKDSDLSTTTQEIRDRLRLQQLERLQQELHGAKQGRTGFGLVPNRQWQESELSSAVKEIRDKMQLQGQPVERFQSKLSGAQEGMTVLGLPPNRQRGSDSELATTAKETNEQIRLQQLELIQKELNEETEAMKALGHFRSKALLAKRDELMLGLNSKPVTPPYKPYRPTIPKYKRKYPRVLFFVHIHKSAGTLFCRLSFRNRINTNRGSNCNVQDDQYCCGGRDTLEAQIVFANNTYWDLVAIERELYDSMAPDYYDYIVTLRDSKSRYYSHWSHLRRMMPIGPGVQTGGFGDSAWIFGNNTIVNDKVRKRRVPPGEDPLGSFEVWSEGQPDNWNTRIICGAKCRPQPKFQITRDLFEYTLERANKFVHFLFVEDLEASYNQIAKAYNWYKYSEIITVALLQDQSKRRRDHHGVDLKVRQEKWNPLMSALDDALYEFAKRKYHNVSQQELWQPFRNQDMLDRYFAEGYKFGCRNGCCFKCTAY